MLFNASNSDDNPMLHNTYFAYPDLDKMGHSASRDKTCSDALVRMQTSRFVKFINKTLQ